MVDRPRPFFLLTVDVEEWFQVENFKPWIADSDWDSIEPRAERSIHRLLDLFEAGGVAATFFTLGWFAGRLPGIVREIVARGHEIASHGMRHQLCSRLSAAELVQDLADSKRRLEDVTGLPVQGFRAPSFAISEAVLGWLPAAGYRYDSSYNSFAWHGRYGRVELNGRPRTGWAWRLGEDFFELPLSNLTIPAVGRSSTTGRPRRFVLPWSGGAYFRLIPPALFRWGVRSILNRHGVYLFYMHPWEIDPDQPRLRSAGLSRRFRHYTNLGETLRRLRRLIEDSAHCRFLTCREYLDQHCHS
jgi:polysaccharide deacetylase family protein (PEP-CTERM system associated)